MMLDSKLLARMVADLGFIESRLLHIIQTAPYRYKAYKIPKRSGGEREVAQPAREVKKLQYWLMDELKRLLPIHQSAMAYREAVSIKDNAQAHAQSAFILKLDFREFFPSIKERDLKKHLAKHCRNRFNEDDLDVICHATMWVKNRRPPRSLCIGAPSSPLLSNSILFDLDSILTESLPGGVRYTRYADDLTFSCGRPGVLGDVERLVSGIVSGLEYPTLTLNPKKTVHASRKGKRFVTGIVLTPDGQISVGRSRKRRARAMFHRSKLGQLGQDEQRALDGLLAFIEHIEPGFKARLERSWLAKASH